MIAGLHVVRCARRGKPLRWYVYAFRGGPQIRVVEQATRPRLTPADVEAVAKAHADLKAEAKPGNTVAAAVAEFRRSRFWNSLAATTRKTWGIALARIETKWPDVPMLVLTDIHARPKIVKWHEEIAKTNPRAADISTMVLAKLFDWAVDQGLATHNPANKISKAYQRTDRAAVVWLEADLEAINAVSELALRDALALAAMTGLRRADLVGLRWDEVGDLSIRRVAEKRSRGKRFVVTLPRLPQLDALLNELKTRPRKEGVETVLVNSRGQSWTGDGLGTSFHDARSRANDGQGIWHVERDPKTGREERIAKRLHDLRGTFATKLMTHPKRPLTDRDIASMMGWSEQQVGEIRKRYVDDRAIVVALAKRLRRGGL